MVSLPYTIVTPTYGGDTYFATMYMASLVQPPAQHERLVGAVPPDFMSSNKLTMEKVTMDWYRSCDRLFVDESASKDYRPIPRVTGECFCLR